MAAHSVDGRVETEDIQGLVLQGYGRLRAAAYIILKITDATLARIWLRDLLPEISLGDTRPETNAVNLALTAPGLIRLGLSAETTAGFSLEFVEGMTTAHRSRLLGDEGPASPAGWTWGGPGGPELHALLLVFARGEDQLAANLGRYRSDFAEHGMSEVVCLDTSDIGRGEHFGFRDGISQPSLPGIGKVGPAMHEVEPGEFLLGYLNEHGQYARSPLVRAVDDPNGLLPKPPRGSGASSAPLAAEAVGEHDFGRNGSYLVLRTLAQDVGGFWRFMDEASRGPDGKTDGKARTALAAHMVGRWPSGAPLTTSPDRDLPELATHNDFSYDETDRNGTCCPIGAHIRRTNPRDSLPPKPGTHESIDVGKRHRLIRRGRSYGPPIDPEASLTSAVGRDARGLQFIALCADIARQFEFITHTWALNPNFAGLYDDADPILGGHAEHGRTFTLQGVPVRRRIPEVPAFVTVRGGAYFFLPGGRALRYLAGA
jgi:Dyp-type peroxidase family